MKTRYVRVTDLGENVVAKLTPFRKEYELSVFVVDVCMCLSDHVRFSFR